MKGQYASISRQPKWLADNAHAALKLSSYAANEILFDQGSLTAVLVKLSNQNFEVNVLSQEISVPYWHEQKKLMKPFSQAAIIREVELLIHGQAVVFARTIIPINMKGSGLKNLGKTPLGHILFKDGRIRISKREFYVIQLENTVRVGRRTPYEYQGNTILVSEHFLPALNDYLV